MSKSRDTDKGWKALRKRADQLAKGATVQVGILGSDVEKIHEPEEGAEEGGEASGVTIGEIGEIGEFGLGNNPVRSWLRGFVDANNRLIQQKVNRLAQAVIKGTLTPIGALEMLGLDMVGGIQTRIAKGIKPQVTAAHQRRKGPTKTTPLINTGQFRGSISYKVTQGRVK